MNKSDINSYNNILSNIHINYSNDLWLGITNINNIKNNNNLSINEKFEKELNERNYNNK
jgi:hypothetical protein